MFGAQVNDCHFVITKTDRGIGIINYICKTHLLTNSQVVFFLGYCKHVQSRRIVDVTVKKINK